MRPRIATFREFRDAISAYRLPRVLLAALELDLFTVIGDRSWMLTTLAKKLKVSERGLNILCRNLASAGVLHKQGSVYRNSQLGATALNANHPAYRGDYLNLIRSHWTDWIRLMEPIRSGLPLDHDVPDSLDFRRRFTRAMHHRTLEMAPAITAQLPLGHAQTLLDLGGGPGTYALAFLAQNPRLRAAVCDREAALEVAKEIASTHKASRRLSYVPLDFTKDPIPGTYDVIWYSNVLHMYSPKENQAIFRRARAALRPGGRFIIQDAFLCDREGLYPTEASLFAISMLLFTERGNTYTVSETAKWLKQAGFVSIKPVPIRKGTEDWEEGIWEASVPSLRSGMIASQKGSSKNRTAR
ncbi:MAG: acetylserotonin O-methyltransferase [Nitrospira sp.]|nr:acetylserotonin O-methyltransferase [Nitrospira sp.]MDH4304833.1 acetylserotonin O-methyltransferase [Nitrospira sp.]MDH5192393.1 acetylserotonin O-methyltransferase [Nitrospira sp.]